MWSSSNPIIPDDLVKLVEEPHEIYLDYQSSTDGQHEQQ